MSVTVLHTPITHVQVLSFLSVHVCDTIAMRPGSVVGVAVRLVEEAPQGGKQTAAVLHLHFTHGVG